jgi:hypothetical protein
MREHYYRTLLVKAGSVDAIDRQLASRISGLARAQVQAKYTWEHAGAALAAAYKEGNSE